VHCTVLLEDAAQSCEAGVGILEVMKNSGADNLIESLSQTAHAIEGQMVDLKVR
jgi:hypothetical protein